MPIRRKRVEWSVGSIFAVPLPDGSRALGQAVAMMWPNVVYCALTKRRISSTQHFDDALDSEDVIALLALSREQLDFGVWSILGVAAPVVPKAQFGNERFVDRGYVGAKIYDAALAEEFLSAFHALAPWDNYHDPAYLDQLLVSASVKPTRLLFRSAPSAG